MEAAVVVRRSEFVLRLELRCSMGLAIRMFGNDSEHRLSQG
jgi:hypothetical protein